MSRYIVWRSFILGNWRAAPAVTFWPNRGFDTWREAYDYADAMARR